MATTFLFSITLAGGFGLGFVMTWYILYTRQKQMKKKYEDTSEQLPMEERFKQIAATALSNNSDEFLKKLDRIINEKKETINNTVSPISEKIGELNNCIKSLEGERKGAYKSLKEVCKKMEEEFNSVFNNPHIAGAWGELSLEKIMKISGMSKNVDYCIKPILPDNKKPDLIIRLPGERCLVVDAKAPLDSYKNVMKAPLYSEERERALKKYIEAVNDHIKSLSKKKYCQTVDISSQKERTPDFVVMYLPLEGMHLLAMENKENIFHEAAEKNIILTNPSSFLALAKTINYVWKEHNFTANTQEIRKISQEILKDLKKHHECSKTLEKHLKKSMTSYNSSAKFFNTNCLPHAEKLRELGCGSAELEPLKENLPT